ncbi:MAG: gephyrin-like molybdotransferase Glp [Anaerolineales bacterium]|nr:gephyrin-like molybdotransferase Glp [Anaerolineales bacterium]
MIGFSEAYRLTLDSIAALDAEYVPVMEAVGRAAAEELTAAIWSPSLDVSLKDGFAVHSEDVSRASPRHEVRLDLVGSISAGGDWEGVVQKGQAVRILSGAPLPEGAQAVLAEEFTRREGKQIIALNTAKPGRNVLPKGADVKPGQQLLNRGEILQPTLVGYLASAGIAEVPVIHIPKIGLIATGDEVIAPGKRLEAGKLFASNLVTLAAWCRKFGFQVSTRVVPDDEERLRDNLVKALEENDAVLTSGGAWKGERDLVVDELENLGWDKTYHRVRMGPGKAVGFGLVGRKPVFCLPGGPPSNHMAFLQLALPGIMKLAGWANPGLAIYPVILNETIRGQRAWTQFIHGQLGSNKGGMEGMSFTPLDYESRLQMMAHSDAVVRIPEGVVSIEAGSIVPAQVF